MKDIDMAIELIELLQKKEKQMDKINSDLRKMYGDFYPHLMTMPDDINGAILRLLDEVLGEELASYYLYDCAGCGLIQEKDGTEFPITSTKQLKKYAQRIRGMKS